MFTNKYNNRNNIIGIEIARRRKQLHISQRELSDRLRREGLDIDKNAVQRIESGQRFITDIEIVYIARVFGVEIPELYGGRNERVCEEDEQPQNGQTYK